MNYYVQYWNEHAQQWNECSSPIMPTKFLSEAERLARVRSEKSVRHFRVRKNRVTVTSWKGGKEEAVFTP